MGRRRNLTTSPEQTEDDLLATPKQTGVEGGWAYSEPVKGDPLSSAAKPGRARAKKNTRKWCKGKVGVPHTLVIEIDPKLSYIKHDCGWRSMRYYIGKKQGFGQIWHWGCKHHEVCGECGKVFRYSWDIKGDCPVFGPHPDVEGVAEPKGEWYGV